MTEPAEPRSAVVVEDDDDLRELLRAVLAQMGLDTVTAATGAEGIEAVRTRQPVVTTLDVSLPDLDGFAVAARLRQVSDTAIIMLTGHSDEVDVLRGLEAGADDYLFKPFRPRELRVRIEALLHRSVPAPAVPPAPLAGVVVDRETRTARVDGLVVELTRSELELLATLADAGRKVTSKTDLSRALRGGAPATERASDADVRAVEVHMANLRRKIGGSGSGPRRIETVRGLGYRLVGD